MIICCIHDDGHCTLQIDGEADQLVNEASEVITSIAKEFALLFDVSKAEAAKTFILSSIMESACKKASILGVMQ